LMNWCAVVLTFLDRLNVLMKLSGRPRAARDKTHRHCCGWPSARKGKMVIIIVTDIDVDWILQVQNSRVWGNVCKEYFLKAFVFTIA
jgi:hypothetical protein